ncbi:tyrosine-type recombinase/integrase [Gilliamella sp. ESL0250]|uniref:tyrosine-type recombinase/integrase n=1 Tax=Gilliamella sp. ESL0250 TaxID=2705036 RepID=UPI00406BFC86
MTTDPTIPLRPPRTPPKRCRLTFDEFKKILNSAKKSRQQYFYQAMIVALVTGQRRSDIVAIQRSDIKNGHLFIEQYKTGAKIALPLNLYCEKLNMTLEHVINNICTGKKYLIENNKKQVKLFSLTQYFSEFRDKIYYERNYWNGTPPSFHEIRSLSERLYRAQGIDTMNLLGHKSQQMTDRYNDSRGREWRYLRI